MEERRIKESHMEEAPEYWAVVLFFYKLFIPLTQNAMLSGIFGFHLFLIHVFCFMAFSPVLFLLFDFSKQECTFQGFLSKVTLWTGFSRVSFKGYHLDWLSLAVEQIASNFSRLKQHLDITLQSPWFRQAGLGPSWAFSQRVSQGWGFI